MRIFAKRAESKSDVVFVVVVVVVIVVVVAIGKMKEADIWSTMTLIKSFPSFQNVKQITFYVCLPFDHWFPLLSSFILHSLLHSHLFHPFGRFQCTYWSLCWIVVGSTKVVVLLKILNANERERWYWHGVIGDISDIEVVQQAENKIGCQSGKERVCDSINKSAWDTFDIELKEINSISMKLKLNFKKREIGVNFRSWREIW